MKIIHIVALALLMISCNTTRVKERSIEYERYNEFSYCYDSCKNILSAMLELKGFTREQVKKSDISRSCVAICTYIEEEINEE